MKQRLAYQISPHWIWTWCAIFGAILILSITSPAGDLITLVKLSGIALCLLYAVRIFPKDHLLLAALFTTCIADLILAHNNTSAIGVIVFLATQLLHLTRIARPSRRRYIYAYAIFAGTLLALDIFLHFIPLLFLAVALYASALFNNIVTCYRWHRHEPESIRALVALAGFVLFACCDFGTGISYLALIGVLPELLYAPANFFVWLFYYPSQILISNSGKYDIISQKEGKSRDSKMEVYGS